MLVFCVVKYAFFPLRYLGICTSLYRWESLPSFVFTSLANILIAFRRSSSKRYLQYFYKQFWISHRDHDGKCYSVLAKARDECMSCTQTVIFFFLSVILTYRSSCKCYLQHIYQQLWFNSRNHNGEWGWSLKLLCQEDGHVTVDQAKRALT